MSRRRLLPLALVLLAGSAAFAPLAPAQVMGVAFSAPESISPFSGEPNVLVAPNGTVFVAALGGGETNLWRKYPSEVDFTRVRVPNAGFGGSDEALAMGPDGVLYVSGQYRDFQVDAGRIVRDATGRPVEINAPTVGVRCHSVVSSSDQGATWGALATTLCPLGEADRQWLAVDDLGHVWLVHHSTCCGHDVLRSTDGGQTFEPSGIANARGRFTGNLFADRPRGLVYEATLCGNATAFAMCVTRTSTAQPAAVWAPVGEPLPVAAEGFHATGAVDADGNVYVAYTDQRPGDAAWTVYVSRFPVGGSAWSAPQPLAAGGTSVLPWIVAGAANRTAVAWFEAGSTLHPHSVPDDAGWNVTLALTTDFTAGSWQQVQVSATPVRFGHVCVMGTACGGRPLGDFFETAVDANGDVHVAWADDVAQAIRYARQVSGPNLS